jgi:hypothetical protein
MECISMQVGTIENPLRIEEIPVQTPGPGEVLIKVVASGVSHTDLHAADGDWPIKPSLPFVPGHPRRRYDMGQLGSFGVSSRNWAPSDRPVLDHGDRKEVAQSGSAHFGDVAG